VSANDESKFHVIRHGGAQVIFAGLFLLCVAATIIAQQAPTNFMFLVGTGFVCVGAEGAEGCPAVAKAARGDGYEFSGAGSFDVEKKSVLASGAFAYKSNRSLLETGVWTATEIVSFTSYGPAPDALRELKVPLRLSPMTPMQRLPAKLTGVVPTGGTMVLKVRLVPVVGLRRNATVELNCAMGNVPPERSIGGVRIAIEGKNAAYDESSGGGVIFLANPAGQGAADRRAISTTPSQQDSEQAPEQTPESNPN
jgi:hypothetical protein